MGDGSGGGGNQQLQPPSDGVSDFLAKDDYIEVMDCSVPASWYSAMVHKGEVDSKKKTAERTVTLLGHFDDEPTATEWRSDGKKYTAERLSETQAALPFFAGDAYTCLLYTSPSPRDLSTSRMPSSA